MDRHYLDHAATSQVLPEAAEAAVRMMREEYGNPSSLHSMGFAASQTLQKSRATVAAVLGCESRELFFTSGGTESINTAIFGVCRKNFRQGKHIVTTAIEHAATLQSVKKLEGEGFSVTYLQPDESGHISTQAFADALRNDTILASVMLVNNETGVALPVQEMGKALKKRCPQALFHIDAVQGLFRVPLTPTKWHCDLLSVSGHKIGAPKGVGALYIKQDLRLPALLYGGGQQDGMRSGTEPMPQIAAFAAACEIRQARLAQDVAHVVALRDLLLREMQEKLPFAVCNGQADVPHVLNISLPGCKSEVLLRLLESENVFVSSGSACSKGRASHVLQAMQLPKARIDSAIRISFAPANTAEDIEALMTALQHGVSRLRRE